MADDPAVLGFLTAINANAGPPAEEVGVEQARQGWAAYLSLAGSGPELPSVTDIAIPGPAGDIPARAYRPTADADGLPVVAFFHGGGWVLGSVDSHDSLCRQLALASGCLVVSVEYRRPPEAPFPAAADDALAAVEWLAAHADEIGGDGTRLAVAGDSAGGNLSAVTTLRAREAGGPSIAFQLLIYPAVDAAMSYPSMRENGEGKLLTAATMTWFWDIYLGPDADRSDPRVSPIAASDLAGLPPALVITAELDPLRDEGEAYAMRLEQAGVPVKVSRYDGQIHAFFGMGSLFPAGATVVDEAGIALREALNP
ncbi:MAG: acetyl esterase [Actinomycetota bacterium]|nr:acetyl esterase [Actinomycetota bacterium]